MSFKLKNSVECPNCMYQNPLFRLTCQNCSSYLRSRIVNIDFWKTFWNVIESPIKTFRKIIYAEHKNFTLLLSLFIAVKLVLLYIFVINIADETKAANLFNISSISILTLSIIFIFIIGSYLITKINSFLGLSNRLKDNLAIIIFSFSPLILVLFILTPVEYALFRNFWYVHNPSPFIIKPVSAYIITGIEGIILVWSLILLVTANFVQTHNKFYSIIITLLFVIFLIVTITLVGLNL